MKSRCEDGDLSPKGEKLDRYYYDSRFARPVAYGKAPGDRRQAFRDGSLTQSAVIIFGFGLFTLSLGGCRLALHLPLRVLG